MKRRRFRAEENANSEADRNQPADDATRHGTGERPQDVNDQNSHRDLQLEQTTQRSPNRLLGDFSTVNLQKVRVSSLLGIAGNLSRLFTGPTTQMPPQPTPMKARPTTIIAAFFAAIRKIQPITKGTKMSKSVRRRPMTFMTMPIKMQTEAAPILRIELQRFHSVGEKMKIWGRMMVQNLTAFI
jgi:hypothetical protein